MPIEAALDELRLLYARLDAELIGAGVECRCCGECCNFVENDYILYASALERELLDRSTDIAPTLKADGSCGFQNGERCGVHDTRPLGCRTAFCSEDWADRQADLYERYRREMVEICLKHDIPWDYRPVVRGV